MTTMIDKTCPNCKRAFQVDDSGLPDEGSMREFALKLPVLCDDCSRAEEQLALRRAEEDAADRRAERVKRSGLPDDLRKVTFEHLDRGLGNEDAIEEAQNWASGKTPGLVLSGPVGIGKTWIAAAAANEMLRYRAVIWCPVSRLITAMRADLDSEVRKNANKLLLAGSTALVLDDLDKAKPTDFALDVIFEAIDERVSHGAPLLVTTNLRYPELVERMGEPIASRVSGYCRGFRLEGDDRRQMKAAA